MSANRIDAIRRSDPLRGMPGEAGVATSSSAPPQEPQNRSLGSFAAPQFGHATTSGAPHSRQNRRSSRLSAEHAPQRMADTLQRGPRSSSPALRVLLESPVAARFGLPSFCLLHGRACPPYAPINQL